MKRLTAFLAVSLLASAATAQIPAHLAGRRVATVRIEGETSGATTAEDVGIPLGSTLTRHLVRSTVEQLIESGRWANVQIDVEAQGADVGLVVHLTPRILVSRIDVIDNERLSDEEVRATIRLGPDGELESQELSRIADAVAAAYHERGYVEVRVRAGLRGTDDPNRKILRVIIAEGEPTRVVEFIYPHDAPPQEVDLPGALGLSEGAVLDRTRFHEGVAEARHRLRAAGYLQARLDAPEVRAVEGGSSLAFSLRLGPHYEIRVIDHEPLERSTVEEVLQLAEHRLTQRTLPDLSTRVVQLYQRHGYRDAEVEIERYRGANRERAILEVRITPGRQLNVVGMSFPGATHFGSDYLRSQVISVLEEELPDTRTIGPVDSDNADRLGLGGGGELLSTRRIPRPLYVDPGRVFYEPLYDRAIEHLREIYEAAGFLSARVGEVRLQSVGRGRAVVVIPIVEGPRTLLFNVALQGNGVIGSHELLEVSGLRRHEPFSYLRLENALQRMTDRYRERGYLYARIEPTIRFSLNRERAEVVLEVVERFEVRFGEITIAGNERASASLIHDALRIREGELYRPSVVQASQDALMALGVFVSVAITPRDPDLPERVKPITVQVRERMPQYFDFQLGISTGQGLRSSFEYGYRNLFGYAVGLTFRAQLGLQFFFQDRQLEDNISGLPVLDRLERRITATMAFPQISGIDDVRATLDLVHLRDNQRVFGLDKNGIVLSFNWRPESRLSFTWSAEVEHNGVQLFGSETIDHILMDPMTTPQIIQLLRVPEGNSAAVSSRVAATVDQRDNSFVPTDGWYAAGSLEWARSLITEAQGDDMRAPVMHILKLSATLNGYVSLGDVVFAGQVRLGGIIPLESGQTTFANRQFFLGGVDTLRGFNQDQLQPQDIADAIIGTENPTVFRGGEFFYLVRAELRFPIYGAIHGAVFTDLGNHWANPTLIVFNADFVRPTLGFGGRVVTPVGPLAIDVGFNPAVREALNEPIVAVHLSLGVF